MTDRELLELAAKAAGIELQLMEIKNASHVGDDCFIGYIVSAEKWPRGWFNPLINDGDALRLAVALKIQITPQTYRDCEVTAFRSGFCEATEKSTMGYGIEEATRRAITKAAAQIGKAMP